MSPVSLPKALWDNTLNQLIDRLNLSEITGDDGGHYMDLISQLPMVQGEVGNVRLFKGDGIYQLVTCSLVVPPIHLDSHMLFVFSDSDCAVPHFTLDSVKAGEHNAFHLDLIPRVDLGSNYTYMTEVFGPLTDLCEEARAIDGMEKAHISPIQYAVMSPWMLVQRASDEAFEKMDKYVDGYLNHWLSIVEKGISPEALEGHSADALIARDARNKSMIFDPAVDPVWGRIEGMIGTDAVSKLRRLLKSTSA
ncbi:hypothetical protein QGN29_03975 [Temperatibacter marinus]|uniref:Red chlorophyll catabolite reductase n=1 Tax=Temperatibacter marinus TaxID=1456591 RepID=A0AA52HB92_9PROT|nr:hypothetical protein [Temperatibacter marinus]WND03530.1 hypothetical protein QGN29_03975 [Temperatibacter marinus]